MDTEELRHLLTIVQEGVVSRRQILGDVTHDRRVTVGQIRAALKARARVRQRKLISDLLDDLETGACSVLERGYMHLVERPHGLPPGDRQVPDHLAGRIIFRDGEWSTYGVALELDGRTWHDGPAARARDSIRDLHTLVERDEVTVRLTFHQVYGDTCKTAALIATLLQRRGWAGAAHPCQNCL